MWELRVHDPCTDPAQLPSELTDRVHQGPFPSPAHGGVSPVFAPSHHRLGWLNQSVVSTARADSDTRQLRISRRLLDGNFSSSRSHDLQTSPSIRRVKNQIPEAFVSDPLDAAPSNDGTCCPLHHSPSLAAGPHLVFQSGNLALELSIHKPRSLFLAPAGQLQCFGCESDILATYPESFNFKLCKTIPSCLQS